MIEGINYYPKKKKPKLRKLILLILFFLIFGSIWYYFQSIDFNRSQSSSIVISKPSIVDESENSVVSSTNDSIPTPIVESNTENLDEVISTYEANTQN
tara:strand:- start:513 stop:806 length:294 start_codon:yes stop_codon:yes gene_type:complete